MKVTVTFINVWYVLRVVKLIEGTGLDSIYIISRHELVYTRRTPV